MVSAAIESNNLEELLKKVILSLRPDLIPPEPIEETGYDLPNAAVKAFKELSDYPPIMEAAHVSEYLSISLSQAYNFLHAQGCPTFYIDKSMKITREGLAEFLKECGGRHLW